MERAIRTSSVCRRGFLLPRYPVFNPWILSLIHIYNIKVNINPETGDFSVYAEKEVVEEVEDPLTQISYAEARLKNPKFFLGDIINLSLIHI